MEGHTTRQARREATAQRILDAARVEFGDAGLERTTVRAIAERAGVDPSLVIQHYGSKAALFAAAIELQAVGDGDPLPQHLRDVIAARLAPPPPATRALVRSMLTSPDAAEVMREFLGERAASLARQSDDADADLRAALVVTSIWGLTLARHFLGLDAFEDVGDREIDEVLAPWLEGVLRPGGTSGSGGG